MHLPFIKLCKCSVSEHFFATFGQHLNTADSVCGGELGFTLGFSDFLLVAKQNREFSARLNYSVFSN